MAFQKIISRAIYTILALLAAFACSSSNALQFHVGGKYGWSPNPKEEYNHWAQRMRFQINDTLLFRYDKSADSVLVVNSTGYNECNTDDPITKLDDSNPIFRFDHSGLFFFISGNKTNCYQQEKMIILVLHVRNRTSGYDNSSPTPAPAPAPGPARAPAPAPAPAPYHHGVVTPSPSPLPWAGAPVPWGDDEPADNDEHKRSFGIRDGAVMRARVVVLMALGLGFVVGWF